MGEVIQFPGTKSAYPGFGKIPRLNRTMVITEKIDGTNAQVFVGEDGAVIAGSGNRWITPESDNYGFASWVAEHEDELQELGPGHHYGEWYGLGIQRGYGLTEKRFALFNVDRWEEMRPACCDVVPVISVVSDVFALSNSVECAAQILRKFGSRIAPGFMNPEGIVIYHTAARQLYKMTLENDATPKALANVA